jgi:hypothetical protein
MFLMTLNLKTSRLLIYLLFGGFGGHGASSGRKATRLSTWIQTFFLVRRLSKHVLSKLPMHLVNQSFIGLTWQPKHVT